MLKHGEELNEAVEAVGVEKGRMNGFDGNEWRVVSNRASMG